MTSSGMFLSVSSIRERERVYSKAIEITYNVLKICKGFIDGTVLGIARPGFHNKQNATYSGRNLEHALNYQTITTPDVLVIHTHGPIERRRHDWPLYVENKIDQQLEAVFIVNGDQFFIHGDSFYNHRSFLDVFTCGCQSGSCGMCCKSGSLVCQGSEGIYLKVYRSLLKLCGLEKKENRREHRRSSLHFIHAATKNSQFCLPEHFLSVLQVLTSNMDKYLFH